MLFRRAAHGGNVVAGLGAFVHDEAMRPLDGLADELGRLKGALRIRDAFAWLGFLLMAPSSASRPVARR